MLYGTRCASLFIAPPKRFIKRNINCSPLYDRSKLSDTPLRVRPALRLASKYLMNDLRTKLIRIVEFQWPHTYDELEKRDVVLEEARKTASSCAEWPSMFLPEPAAAICLAEEFGILSITPAAYYDLLRCSASSTWDTALQKNTFDLTPGKKPARWGILPCLALHKALMLKELYEDSDRFKDWSIFTTNRSSCSNREECRVVWLAAYTDKAARIAMLKSRDPLLGIREAEERMMGNDLCPECYDLVSERAKAVKEDIWAKVRAICCPSAEA